MRRDTTQWFTGESVHSPPITPSGETPDELLAEVRQIVRDLERELTPRP